MPRAFAVIIAISAQATSSRGFIACSGPWAMPIETLSRPAGSISVSPRRVDDPAGEPEGVARVARGHDHAELLAAEAADDVGDADDALEQVGQLDEHEVAGRRGRGRR